VTKSTWKNVVELKHLLTEDQFSWLSKYQARSELARNLQQVGFDSLSVGASQGYYILLKLSLVDNALEMLSEVTGKNFHIFHPQVSRALRDGAFDKLLLSNQRVNARKRGLTTEVQVPKRMTSGNAEQDLKAFISLIRNGMFHGSLTPSETGLAGSARKRLLLESLAEEALKQADTYLQTWLIKYEKKSVRQIKNMGAKT